MNNAVALQLGLVVAIAGSAWAVPDDAKTNGVADTRQQVWAVRISKLMSDPSGRAPSAHYETENLSFSPDGKQLAVAVNRSRLLVLDSQSPETHVRQFDLLGACGTDVAWSDRGDALLACGTLIRLSDGASCDATGVQPIILRQASSIRAFWLDSEHVVRSHTGEILDLNCKHVGVWQLAPAWQIGEVAPSKGWVFLWHFERQPPETRFTLVDRATHHTLSGWPMKKVPQPSRNAMLAVGAEAWCFSFHKPGVLANGELRCREVNGGAEIPVLEQIRSYSLMEAAYSSARVVAEKWEQPGLGSWAGWWVPVPGFAAVPVSRMVFDLRSGRVIASWKPRIQESSSPYMADHPYHCALSSSGQYLAESGDDSIELYRLPQ